MQFLSHNGLARPMHFHCLDAVSYGMTTVKEARPEETCNDRGFETDTPGPTHRDCYKISLLTFRALFIAAGLTSCTEPQELSSTLATPDLPMECFFLSSRRKNRVCGFDAHSAL